MYSWPENVCQAQNCDYNNFLHLTLCFNIVTWSHTKLHVMFWPQSTLYSADWNHCFSWVARVEFCVYLTSFLVLHSKLLFYSLSAGTSFMEYVSDILHIVIDGRTLTFWPVTTNMTTYCHQTSHIFYSSYIHTLGNKIKSLILNYF